MIIVVKEVCQFILDNLDNDITLEELEKNFFYNRYYLIRIFKECTGYTIKDFINTVKVLKTIDPLLFTNNTILKIALNNGFNSQEYYSEKFQDIIGTSPIKFRKEFQEIDSLSNVDELKLRKQYLMYLNKYQSQLLNMSNNVEKIEKIKKLVR